MLLAPVIIRVASELKIDFVGPLVLAAIISNWAAPTPLRDAATFLVGGSIGMSFTPVSPAREPGGRPCPCCPVTVLPSDYERNVDGGCYPTDLRTEPLQRPWVSAISLRISSLWSCSFLFRIKLPNHPIGPAAAAIACLPMSLLVIQGAMVSTLATY